MKTTSSEINFADVLVQNNKASGYGGGVFIDSGTASKIYIGDQARIITNTGGYGGGVAFFLRE